MSDHSTLPPASNRTEQHVRDVMAMRERAAERVLDYRRTGVTPPSAIADAIRALPLFTGEEVGPDERVRAAATDLLEACKAALKHLCDTDACYAGRKVRAAIAKATGAANG